MQKDMVVVVVLLMLLAIVLIGSMLARLYRKAGPHEAMIVYGRKGTRIVKGRGTVIWPVVETYKSLSLELMSFDVAPQQDLYTRQGVAVTVEAVAQIDRKSTRLNSSHRCISYAVFCLKKKKKKMTQLSTTVRPALIASRRTSNPHR